MVGDLREGFWLRKTFALPHIAEECYTLFMQNWWDPPRSRVIFNRGDGSSAPWIIINHNHLLEIIKQSGFVLQVLFYSPWLAN